MSRKLEMSIPSPVFHAGRMLLAVVAGMALALALVAAVELFSSVVHPIPADFNGNMGEHVRRYPHWVLGVRCAGVGGNIHSRHLGCIESWWSTGRHRCDAVTRVGAHLQPDHVAVYDVVQDRDVLCLSNRVPTWHQVRQASSITCRGYGRRVAIKLIATPESMGLRGPW